jgi:hypothetical protein
MFGLFQSRRMAWQDQSELRHIRQKYGDQALAIIEARARDRDLSKRSSRHWKRMAGLLKQATG